jgi:hypothetical protein
MTDTQITVDALEQELLETERFIAAARARQAKLLAALDRVQVHTADGLRTLEDWVAARLDLPPERARRLTTAARTLGEHPEVARRFTAGDIGLDRAVLTAGLAAVAPPEVVDRSEGWDLGRLRREVTRWRRHTPRDEQQVFRDRYLNLQPSLDNATVRGSFEVPGFEGELVTRALTERADMFGDLPGPRIPRPAVLADALVSIAQDSLEGAGGDGTGRSEPVVSIFADAQAVAPSRGEAGAETASGLRVGPDLLAEMLCVGRIGVIATRDLEPVSYTATTRGIPPATRRFVLHRDGGCTVAGCRSRYRLQPHHLDPYARDGDHHPDNLTTLCWYHHHVIVHRLGHRFDPDSPPGRRRFLRRRSTGTDPPDG